MHEAINMMNRILFFNNSISSLKYVIIASEKKSIAMLVRKFIAVPKKFG
jgi:hypothetical protein